MMATQKLAMLDQTVRRSSYFHFESRNASLDKEIRLDSPGMKRLRVRKRTNPNWTLSQYGTGGFLRLATHQQFAVKCRRERPRSGGSARDASRTAGDTPAVNQGVYS
jgi:hypothetical protein